MIKPRYSFGGEILILILIAFYDFFKIKTGEEKKNFSGERQQLFRDETERGKSRRNRIFFWQTRTSNGFSLASIRNWNANLNDQIRGSRTG